MEKEIKASDWITDFLVKKGVTDIFGYPGGMAVHLMDSLSKSNAIVPHVTYNEQGAAFAACGYAQVKNDVGVCFSSSGPGFTNMITGIANAFYDSIPLIILTFNVNTYESARNMPIRQKGFQEMNVVSVSKNITKDSFYVSKIEDLPEVMETAFHLANDGRKGPVLVDIPMNVSREYLSTSFSSNTILVKESSMINIQLIEKLLLESNRPLLLLGNGLHNVKNESILELVEKFNIPVITSMVAIDVISKNHNLNYGFVGAYGCRISNFIAAKSDLIISIGSRLDCRQVSTNRASFAPQAKIIRFDIDQNELSYVVKDNEYQFVSDVTDVIDLFQNKLNVNKNYDNWIEICEKIKANLINKDMQIGNNYVDIISKNIEDNVVITADVGQNQVWVAHSFNVKNNQRILFSGNFGSMGYSLPAAIGAYYANKQPIYSFNGDGGIQMNIQELQYISNSRIPIKIFIFNNNSLGMIRHFQEMYMNNNYTLTTMDGGYSHPDFKKIAYAYNLKYQLINSYEDAEHIKYNDEPEIIEIVLPDHTYVFPKLAMGRPSQDQDPLIDRKIYEFLMNL